MKHCSRLLILFILCGFSYKTSNAQIYKDAVGVRVGPSAPAIKTGFTYKHFLNDSHALEAMLSVSEGIGLGVLYEIHQPLTVQNLQWYLGFGGYAAAYKKDSYVGAAGIIGIDYTFPQIPLNISVDWKPELNLIEKLYFEGSTVGFSFRYVIR